MGEGTQRDNDGVLPHSLPAHRHRPSSTIGGEPERSRGAQTAHNKDQGLGLKGVLVEARPAGMTTWQDRKPHGLVSR